MTTQQYHAQPPGNQAQENWTCLLENTYSNPAVNTITVIKTKRKQTKDHLAGGAWSSITRINSVHNKDKQSWIMEPNLVSGLTYLPLPCLNNASISSNVLFLVSGTFLYVKIQKMARNTLNGRNV